MSTQPSPAVQPNTPEAKAIADYERLKRWIQDWIKGKK